MLILLLANLSLHHYCIHNSDSVFSDGQKTSLRLEHTLPIRQDLIPLDDRAKDGHLILFAYRSSSSSLGTWLPLEKLQSLPDMVDPG